jgi:uncharacterized UBP type Zn finger protein
LGYFGWVYLGGFLIANPADRGVEEELLREEGSQPGIRPQMFKNLIGKGHPEFSTNKQQDAQEFFLHLVTQIGKVLTVLRIQIRCLFDPGIRDG